MACALCIGFSATATGATFELTFRAVNGSVSFNGAPPANIDLTVKLSADTNTLVRGAGYAGSDRYPNLTAFVSSAALGFFNVPARTPLSVDIGAPNSIPPFKNTSVLLVSGIVVSGMFSAPALVAWDRISPIGPLIMPATASGTLLITLSNGNTLGIVNFENAKPFGHASFEAIATGLSVNPSGFTYQAVQGGGTPSPETFLVLTGTAQPVDFTLTTSTLAGGSWLSVIPASGTVAPGRPAAIGVSVNSANLSPSDYYGQIRLDAPQAPNSPQFLSVVLNVSAPTVNPGPVVEPTGLVFVGLLNGADPPGQSVRITNLTNHPSPFTVTTTFASAQKWFTASPLSGTVLPDQPGGVTVQPNLTGLAAGVYRGSLVLQFPQDNASRSIDLLLVVTASLTSSTTSPGIPAAACQPTKLMPVFAQLGSDFSTAVAWPTPIDVLVVDDCGTLVKTGHVSASFSNGDAPLTCASLQNGHWSVTWAPVNPRNSSLMVTVTAEQPDQNLQGSSQVSGSAQPNANVPVIYPDGLVSAGSYSKAPAPSPGELGSLFGANLADGLDQASTLPLPILLKGATLALGGRPLPLIFTNAGQINLQVPYQLTPGTKQQLIATRGTRLSAPQTITVGATQPAIFTVNSSGTGQGHIYGFPKPDLQVLADASAPAKAGDTVVIYCTGLGAVQPQVSEGTAVPSDVLRTTVNPVSLTIGGILATVSFAGLTPGFTGLYQINAVVPDGLTPNNQTPVVVTAGPSPSPPVTMAVQ